MGNTLSSAAIASSSSYAEDTQAYWNDDFPKGTKQLFDKYHNQIHFKNVKALIELTKDDNRFQGTQDVTFSFPGEKIRDGLDVVLNFVILSSELFVEDESYHWNLWQTMKSACIIAAKFLLTKNDRGALLMTFYIALFKEFLARGPDDVMGCWVVHHHHGGLKRTLDEDGINVIRLGDQILFSDLAYLNEAVALTRHRKSMSSFLSKTLQKHCNTVNWIRLVGYMVEHESKNERSIHSFSTGNAVPQKLMAINLRGKDKDFVIYVYKDAQLMWLFRYALAFMHGTYKLLDGTHHTNLKHFPCLCLWNIKDSSVLHLKRYSNKTVDELGIKE